MWSDFNYKPLPNAQTSSNSKFPTDPASVLKIFRANADEMRIKSESGETLVNITRLLLTIPLRAVVDPQ